MIRRSSQHLPLWDGPASPGGDGPASLGRDGPEAPAALVAPPPAATPLTGKRVPILLPVALDQTYDYWLGERQPLPPGTFVLVPFGPQTRIGIVWDHPIEAANAKRVDPKRMKTITEPLDVPPLPAITLKFAEWMARYTLAPLGMTARLMMGASSAFEAVRPRFGVQLAQGAATPPRMTPARERAVKVASDGLIRVKSTLANEAQCTTGVVDGLIKAGLLVEVQIAQRAYARPNPDHAVVEFRAEQIPAVETLRAAVDGDNFSVSLLDGVTGSGKTEVYFEALARTLSKGKQALILLPEIALTSQFIRRFSNRFGCPPVEWHSALSALERGRIWKAVATGDARVVVGARSGLFLPFIDLGLIVVDEEHDQGFKQDDRVHYQGRDMAVVRAQLGKFPLILASATPSIESHVNARNGRYRHVILPGRYSGAEMPEITAIDLRQNPPDKGRWLSQPLVNAVNETLAKRQQALLFLNRRGYAPLTICRACGHRFECPQCTAWLVEHRFRKSLSCHHCGFHLPLPEKCPKCGEAGCLVPCGPGVERIAEEVAERFPQARLAMLSSDLIPGLLEMREVISMIERGEADIIIGTQMVAKGHHFPDLATVGVVDGDLGLGGADPRAAERTFQLMHQVTGRAGRSFAGGRGFIQTYMPEHPVMAAIVAGDREAFIEREIMTRQMGLLPPFGRLVAIIVSAKMKDTAERYARELARLAPPAERIEVLGPAEAPLFIIRGLHRFRLLVKAPRELDVQAYLRAWMAAAPEARGDLRVTVDIDPYSFL